MSENIINSSEGNKKYAKYSQKKLPELKEACKSKGLKVGGSKDDLINRLMNPRDIENLSPQNAKTTKMSAFMDMKVPELKQLCREKGLIVSGNKSQMVNRLMNPNNPKSRPQLKVWCAPGMSPVATYGESGEPHIEFLPSFMTRRH